MMNFSALLCVLFNCCMINDACGAFISSDELEHKATLRTIERLYNNFKRNKYPENIPYYGGFSRQLDNAFNLEAILDIVKQYPHCTRNFRKSMKHPAFIILLDDIIQRLLTGKIHKDSKYQSESGIELEIVDEIENILKNIQTQANDKNEIYTITYQLLFLNRLLNANDNFIKLFEDIVICSDGTLPRVDTNMMMLVLESIELYNFDASEQCRITRIIFLLNVNEFSDNDVYLKLFTKISSINDDCAYELINPMINMYLKKNYDDMDIMVLKGIKVAIDAIQQRIKRRLTAMYQ